MFILTQKRKKIVNLSSVSQIYIDEGVVLAMCGGKRILLGGYKSDIRAVEVLLEIFGAKDKYAMPVE